MSFGEDLMLDFAIAVQEQQQVFDFLSSFGYNNRHKRIENGHSIVTAVVSLYLRATPCRVRQRACPGNLLASKHSPYPNHQPICVSVQKSDAEAWLVYLLTQHDIHPASARSQGGET